MSSRLLLLSLLLAVPSLAGEETTDVFALVTSTGRIGTLKVTTVRNTVDVDWRVDDNGRGPKIREHIVLGRSGLPLRREIEGTAWAGAPVKETFLVEDGRARWKSLDDSGEAAAGNALYLDNRGSPWTRLHQLRMLLGSKNLTRPALPGGTIRLQKLRSVTLGPRQERFVSYALWGVGLSPDFLLARGNQLVAELQPSGVLVREQYADSFDALSHLAADLSAEVLQQTSAKLAHRIDQPVWLTNVKVFDPAARTSTAGRNVVVYRGRIVGLRNETPPPQAVVIDGAGGTLLPGLFDSHAHMSDWDGFLHLASGVTLVRDPGNDNQTLLTLVRRIEAGELLGPRVVMSGFLEGRSPFSANNGFVISSVDEAREKVHWYADHGFWGIKIYNSMPPEFVKPIAEEAHRLGLHVSGHVPAFTTAEQMIRDGYDEINHINQLLLMFLLKDKEDPRTPFRATAIGERLGKLDLAGPDVRRVLALMKERKTTLDVTIAVFSWLLQARPGLASPTDGPWLDHVPAYVQRDRKSAGLDIKPAQYPVYDASWKRMEEFLALLYREGIPLVPGTDNIAGLGLHSELESWVKAGIPAPAVLTAATLGGARFLGREADLGTIAVGKRADLYLVDGDPLKNIGDIRRGRLVVKDDAFYFPDEMLAVLEIKPFAARTEIRNAGLGSPTSH